MTHTTYPTPPAERERFAPGLYGTPVASTGVLAITLTRTEVPAGGTPTFAALVRDRARRATVLPFRAASPRRLRTVAA